MEKRIEKAEIKFKELFGETKFQSILNDPEFSEILNNFVFGDVAHRGKLSDKERELLTLVMLTTNQTYPQLNAHINVSLNIGITPVEIKEAIYQCAPYIGFPKVLNALSIVNEVFISKKIKLPIEKQKNIKEENRFDKGLKIQHKIFGKEIIDNIYLNKNESKNQKHILKYLSEMCFGDFYTRNGLDLKTREMLTLGIVNTLGGTEKQIKAHIYGNLNIGNDTDKIIDILTQGILYIGFPRTLNSLDILNEVIKEKNNI